MDAPRVDPGDSLPTPADFAAHPTANAAFVYLRPDDVPVVADALGAATAVTTAWPRLPKGFGTDLPREWRRSRLELVEYSRNSLAYSYDLSNDGQRNVTLHTQLDRLGRRDYTLLGLEEALPAHRFPCTREIDRVAHIRRDVYRVHHRLAMHIDRVREAGGSEYTLIYFKYTHGPQVDLPAVLQQLRVAVGRVVRALRLV
jgi:hypothetical protein